MACRDLEREFLAWVTQKAIGAKEPDSHLFWLHDRKEGQYHGGCLREGGNCGDFCEDCITNAPALVPLTMCLLLDLLGLNGSGTREHIYEKESFYCARCDGYSKECWSPARECMERVWAARDGGWRSDADGPRFCDGCGRELIVSLTAFAAGEELSHFTEYPPDDPDSWRCVRDAFEAADDETRAEFLTLAPSWGFTASAAPAA